MFDVSQEERRTKKGEMSLSTNVTRITPLVASVLTTLLLLLLLLVPDPVRLGAAAVSLAGVQRAAELNIYIISCSRCSAAVPVH